MKRVLAEISSAGHPLKGVFHLAMVIDDAPISVLNRERMRDVFAPKAHGAWLLHEGTLGYGSRLLRDVLVGFEHLRKLRPRPTTRRRTRFSTRSPTIAAPLGLPALAINWGALGGEGYVARNERVAEYLARSGNHASNTRRGDRC